MLGNAQKQYNHLNLPTSVIFGTTGQIDYIYDATGMKQKKMVTENGNTNTTMYASGFTYLNNEMEFFPHAEGYVEPVAQTSGSVKGSSGGVTTYSSFKYVFQYKDHLGNVRLSYADNDLNGSISTSEIIEESNYYPFGLKQKGYNNTISGGNDLAQKWKYNGIEYNQDLSLNLYEMAFRSYDPAIGRFNGIDPVTHYSMGTSVAFDNNPVFWADPSGANSSTGPLALRQYNKTGNADALGTGLFASGTFDFMTPKPPNKYKTIFRSLRAQNANAYLGGFTAAKIGAGDALEDAAVSKLDLLLGPALSLLKSTFDLAKDEGNSGAINFIPLYQVYNQIASTGDTILDTATSLSNGDYYGAGNTSTSFLIQKGYELGVSYATISAGSVFSRIPVTTKDGFLYGSINLRLPFDLRVGLYASEKTLTHGTYRWSTITPNILARNSWFGRNMLQINLEMQSSLGPWSRQTIPKGTPLKFGLIGPQNGVGAGTWFQFYSPEKLRFKF